MGKKVSVSTAAMHLADGSKDPLIEAMLHAIIANEGLPEGIIKCLIGGLGVRMKRAFKYARDEYYYGLPKGRTSTYPVVDEDTVRGIIETELGLTDGIIILSNITTIMSVGMAILPVLLDLRGYDISKNEITIFPNDVVWPAHCTEIEEHGDDCIGWDDPDSLTHRITIGGIEISQDRTTAICHYSQWTLMYTVDTDGDRGGVEYQPGWLDENLEYVEELAIPDWENIIYDTPIVYVQYRKYDSMGVILPEVYNWSYDIASGVYPELDIVNNEQEDDYFLPVVPLRYKNKDYTDPSRMNTERYITSKKLLQKLKMSYTDLGDKLNENPSIDDIDHAYVMFGGDVGTSISSTLWYLGLFFHQLYSIQQNDRSDYMADLSNNTIDSNKDINTYNSSDENGMDFEEKGLNLDISYSYIESTTRTGRIGKKGEAVSKWLPFTKTESVGMPPGIGSPPPENDCGDHGCGALDSGPATTKLVSDVKLIIEMQIAKRTIRKISIVGLQTKNYIYHSHDVKTTLMDVYKKLQEIENPPPEPDPDDPPPDPESLPSDNHNLIIPIQFHMGQSMKLRYRNLLYIDSSMLIINSYVVTKTKWYQSKLFKIVLVLVAVVIAVYTGQVWLVGLLDAAEVGAMAVLTYLVTALVVTVVVDMSVDWIVDHYGAKFGIIGSIALMAIGMAFGDALGSFSIMGSTMTTAQMMMQTSIALISAVNEFLIEVGQSIVDEYIDFQEKLEDRYEDLRTAQDLLNNKSDFDPLTFVAPARFRMPPSESPDMFFSRCLDYPSNSFFTVHDQIPNFCGSKTTQQRTIAANLYSKNIHT